MRSLNFLFFWCLPVLIAAQHSSQFDFKGLQHIYNAEFDSALSVYRNVLADDSNNVTAHYRIAQINHWSFIGTRDEIYSGQFNLHFEKAVNSIENEPDSILNSIEMSYTLGRLYQFRATISSLDNDVISAFLDARTSTEYFERCIDSDSLFLPAYSGLGTFSYALSFVPGFFSWVIDITGLLNDRERGLNLISKSLDKSYPEYPESAYYLSKIYIDYVAEYDSASSILTELNAKYPDNPLFSYQLAVLLIRNKKLSQAESILLKIAPMRHPQFYQTNALAWFLLGEIYFRRNRFAEAVNYYRNFIDRTNSIDYTGIANLRLAVCFHFLNEGLEYQRHLLLARNGNLDIFEDLEAKRLSEEFFNDTISIEDEVVIKAENLLENGLPEDALDLVAVLDSAQLSDRSDRFGRLKSMILFEIGELDSAEAISREMIQNSNLEGTFEYYSACLLLARILFIQNKYEESESYLDMTDGYESLDVSFKLDARINNLKRKLKFAGISGKFN